MTKVELVAKVAAEAEVTKKAAAAVIEAFVNTVTASVAKGEKVALIGFGTFEARARAAREGRNPQDPKKIIKIKATTVPAFKAGKAFKEAVAKKKK